MHNFIALTGAPGGGKTAVIEALRRLGHRCVDEPAREILAEQRSVGGHGLPAEDPRLFTELLLSRSLFNYRRIESGDRPLFFDRGIPDVVGYGDYYGLETGHTLSAARQYRYAKTVFVTPDWEEIYGNDDERTMTYDEAQHFGDAICRIYEELGYDLVELPRESPESRAQFILSRLAETA